MALAGTALRVTSVGVRALQFCGAIIILGIFSYFLAILTHNNYPVATWIRAVEGISGAAALYTLIGLFLVCCLGGVTFFAFLGIVLDICFIGCFIAVAILTRGSNVNCNATNTYSATDFGNGPIGFGDGNNVSSAPSLVRACELEKATFVIAIILVILFLISAALSLFLGRHHQREKRQPGYTRGGSSMRPIWARKTQQQPNTPVIAGTPRRHFWQRNSAADVEAAPVGTYRPSHETQTTMVDPNSNVTYGGANSKYGNGTNNGVLGHSHHNSAASYGNNNTSYGRDGTTYGNTGNGQWPNTTEYAHAHPLGRVE
jgi:hypothetical protein